MRAQDLRCGDVVKIPDRAGWRSGYRFLIGREVEIISTDPFPGPSFRVSDSGDLYHVDDNEFSFEFVRPGIPPQPSRTDIRNALKALRRAKELVPPVVQGIIGFRSPEQVPLREVEDLIRFLENHLKDDK